ncbi:hypothetical protein B4098_0302 [Heyndrickxia coagulans]|uniref:Uncharacterized protein n=1 Tax=Heyndrickxia coagulans TaxID=1398 RepID=A0A150JV27_HEYCO|nr:hypothetical protein B4098_0302 [Heyndrickxia coagulans]
MDWEPRPILKAIHFKCRGKSANAVNFNVFPKEVSHPQGM